MAPHEFKLLWLLGIHGPLAAEELASDANRGAASYAQRTGQGVGNQLRRFVRGGLVEHDGGRPAIYRLTDKGRAYVDA